MGLYFAPEKCENEKCGSRNTKMIGWHEYECLDCGYKWEDTIAAASKVFTELIEKGAAFLAQKLPGKFR